MTMHRTKPGVRFHIRDAGDETGLWIGPGKIALLEAIEQTGSITSSARKLGMSYRRAWLLIEATNRCLVHPAVKTTAGGRRGGGTSLTRTGSELVRRYRALEQETERAVAHRLTRLLRTVATRDQLGQRISGR
jgi:molybdate transport system regulatory protein